MLGTERDKPLLMGPSTAARICLRCLRLCSPGILFVSCAVFGAAQCSAQDVAEAARHERAQKESRQKKSKHVYTEQDLKRAQILSPEDRAQVAAKKNQLAPPSAEKSQEALDAQSLSHDSPLASASGSRSSAAAARSGSGRARGTCRSGDTERRAKTQRRDREERRLALEDRGAKFGRGAPLARPA